VNAPKIDGWKGIVAYLDERLPVAVTKQAARNWQAFYGLPVRALRIDYRVYARCDELDVWIEQALGEKPGMKRRRTPAPGPQPQQRGLRCATGGGSGSSSRPTR
jgi:hypothetical protein